MHVMKKLLFLSLSLLCLSEVLGLRCNTCEMSRSSRCMKGKNTCHAKKDESCATISYFMRNTHMYSRHICQPQCQENQAAYQDKLRVTMCCRKNLCNIF